MERRNAELRATTRSKEEVSITTYAVILTHTHSALYGIVAVKHVVSFKSQEPLKASQ
jgi:hypothetical protein